MIFSKETFSGFICIDHTDSPGFTAEHAPLRGSVLPFTGAGQKFQAATNTCSHCDAVVIRNPLRTRPRGHCRGCDYFICDPCEAIYFLNGGKCRCRNKRHDEILKGVTLNGS